MARNECVCLQLLFKGLELTREARIGAFLKDRDRVQDNLDAISSNLIGMGLACELKRYDEMNDLIYDAFFAAGERKWDKASETLEGLRKLFEEEIVETTKCTSRFV